MSEAPTEAGPAAEPEVEGGGQRAAVDRFLAVVERELTTTVRTRSVLALAVGFAVVVVGLGWVGGTVGYVPAVLNLLTPTELLVPVLALAFGFRAVLGDAERGELDVLRTYPVERTEYVLGVYVGRATALVVVLLVPYLLVGLLVAVAGGAGTSVVASHAGADSVLLYVRFVVLTVLLGLVALAVALAISAAAAGARSAVALAVGAALVLGVGFDLAIVGGLGGGYVSEGAVRWLLALSPTGAFRGLVLRTVLDPVLSGASGSGLPDLVGLVLWFVGALFVALVTVAPVRWRR